MADRWMDILDAAGDANLGQTILRLAGLAAEADQAHRVAALQAAALRTETRAHGSGPAPNVHARRQAAVHKEVDR
jgi:hypothetical protein